MLISHPCIKQLSIFADSSSPDKHHKWKDDTCIHCGVRKGSPKIHVCDCGCGTIITDENEALSYANLIYVFGHETRDLFGDSIV